jgi:hypothetical protein
MQSKVDELCTSATGSWVSNEDSIRAPTKSSRADRAALPMNWYDQNADNPPWIRAFAEVRHMGAREGYCYHHVQMIMLAIDQYAETALRNRNYFLNRPHGVGGM